MIVPATSPTVDPRTGSSRTTQHRRGRSVRKLLRDPPAVAGAILLIIVATALLATPLLGLENPLAVDVPGRLAGFTWEHPLGTDGIGRDNLSRILYGGRTSLTITVAVVALVTVIGLALGVVAGMQGGVLDGAVMRAVEIVQSVPLIIVALVTVALLRGGTPTLVVVLGVLGWTGQARVVRAATLSLRERPFIEASHALGSSRLRIAVRHIVPNLLGPVIVLATLDIGRILLTVSTLSFLGFGPPPPAPEWGSMLAEARVYFFAAPRLLIIPGVAIFLVAISANLFGEGLREAFDTRTARA